jgi:AraC-like DNA-binding protein
MVLKANDGTGVPARTMSAKTRTEAASGSRSGEIFVHLVRGLRDDGLDPAEVLARAAPAREAPGALTALVAWLRSPPGSSPRPFAGAQIPASVVWSAWEATLAATDGQVAPIRYALGIPREESRHVARMVATTATTVGAAAKAFVEFSPLIAAAYRFFVVEDERGGALSVDAIPDRDGARADVLFLTATFVSWIERMLGDGARASLEWDVPWDACDPRVSELLGITPRLGAPLYALRTSLERWNARAAMSDPPLQARLVELARQSASLLEPSTSTRVRAAIASATPQDLSAEGIARRCGMSPRSMRRELQREGTSFQTLLDAWRRTEALIWVQRETDGELAARLGFSDARSLRRAFMGWTGTTPSRKRTLE